MDKKLRKLNGKKRKRDNELNLFKYNHIQIIQY